MKSAFPPPVSLPPSALDSGAFPIAPPELVGERALLTRIDRKFVLPEDRLAALVLDLERDYLVIEANGRKVAKYVTTYFDTPTLRSFRDHARRVPRRWKVRERHYVDRDVTYLEVKRRTGRGLTEKHRHLRLFKEAALSPAERTFLTSLVREEEPLAPQLAIQCRRLSLVSRASDVRVTIDSTLRFSSKSSSMAASLGPLAIVEVKFVERPSAREVIARLRHHGAREHSVSKYCVGMCTLRLASDRAFRDMLRALRMGTTP